MAKVGAPLLPQPSAARPVEESLDHEVVIAQLERIFASGDFEGLPEAWAR